jgi:arginyl-tRNA synthetase
VIAFDFQEALSFEGETGPYCQYAAVRINSIFRKLGTELVEKAELVLSQVTSTGEIRNRVSEVLSGEGGTEIWSLVMLAERLSDVIQQGKTSAEPANLAKYTFTLAKAFSTFYQKFRILQEEDDVRQAVLIATTTIVRRQLNAALDILGIRVPNQM